MTSSWIETRRPVPPAGVAEYLRGVITAASRHPGVPPRGQPSMPDPQALASAALELLARVTARPAGGRELARDLLAADALVTYAFEAQAELDVDRLVALADFVARERRPEGV